jgi:hypothetical protein
VILLGIQVENGICSGFKTTKKECGIKKSRETEEGWTHVYHHWNIIPFGKD